MALHARSLPRRVCVPVRTPVPNVESLAQLRDGGAQASTSSRSRRSAVTRASLSEVAQSVGSLASYEFDDFGLETKFYDWKYNRCDEKDPDGYY